MEPIIKVLIVDDHSIVRVGLSQILSGESGLEIVGEAADGIEAVQKAVELKPDLVLMDIFMPKANGLQATLNIKEALPQTRILILTVSDQETDLFQALRLGADGYLLKNASIAEVPDAIRKTMAGEAVLSPAIAGKLVAEFKQKANQPALSEREKEVLNLVGDGCQNSEIARRLFIDESTVRSYLHRLMEKLHLNNRAEAVAYARRYIL
jgi:two-component system NarL family response regulator